ncbi:hypothetical protein BGZ63DRAFT_435738 [Mariannaea sp. PMI_226]|nr:hypothetical protein BGZ63DRAFT_435738 [Mariannaea sp. PMI_226]
MSFEDVLREYQGRAVAQSYNAGFVVLSYLVSLIGAASTLELINRRTGLKGLFNHLLLLSSAVTMGGISIWCMHFIGNAAINLANGEPELQVEYSTGFTAISFFVPIIVLLAAFVAVGTNNRVSWWRVTVGGILCGATICGMHYLGNASITNYVCIYRPAYVVGAATISVVASIVALAMFFIFRAMWATSWWKRTISAVVLAGAVSGMHWCAAVGTRYRLVNIKSKKNKLSRSATVIIVIFLSLGACVIMAGLAILRARNMRRFALRAQQITLAAAVFHKDGRVLVDPDGLIPSTVVADSFLEKNTKEGFTIAHSLFHWMFQASRNWSGISRLINSMNYHLTQLRDSGYNKNGKRGVRLINDHGELIEEFDIIFRELFCVAAAALSNRLREDLTSVGVLWDEILQTGSGSKRTQGQHQPRPFSIDVNAIKADPGTTDVVKKGLDCQQEYSRGSLMFLVRRVDTDREAERLVSSGYRFADLHQVCDIIRSSMQIQTPGFEAKMWDMAAYADQQDRIPPGVHLGLFAIQPRVKLGFYVVVRKGTRNLLPSMALPINSIEKWQAEFLKQLQSLTVTELRQTLRDCSSRRSSEETKFAAQLCDAIEALREWIEEPFFEDAAFTPTIVRLHSQDGDGQAETFMIALRLVIPIHSMLSSPSCELVPLSFFRMRQVADQFQQRFMEDVHREFWRIFKRIGCPTDGPEDKQSGLSSKLRFFGSAEKSASSLSGHPLLSSESVQTSSTTDLRSPGDDRSQSLRIIDDSGQKNSHQPPPSYSGIMVSQEISINIKGIHSDTEAYRQPLEVQIPIGTKRLSDRTSLTESGIELRPMGHGGAKIAAVSQVSHIETRNGDLNNILSFVDVFFAEFVKSR